ncbi:MAG: DegT/DnrJ/EryC1/StrS family aminotransferase [Candidatus Hydrogenedentota bacterium]|nr:MAG: DegT/DnrJ/EryC1/StrS family aminotransferase [Candidatus Hydrogenedentota bacterium]
MRRFIPVAEPVLGEAEVRAVAECVRSGWISPLSSSVREFEERFAAYCGVSEAVAVSSGTAGLHLVLVALGLGYGDEVIIPDMTFVATANAVAYTGARVVTADVDPRTWNITPETVARVLTRRTKAVIPVHLFGNPADVEGIKRLVGRKVVVIEDAAESHGAVFRGRKTGALGTAGVFSFYANKLITTGEGGMITCRSRGLGRRLRFLLDQAMDPNRRYYHPEIGFNYRLTGMQAALGIAQMRRIKSLLSAKHRIAKWYQEFLKDKRGLEFQQQQSGAESSWWMVSILLPKGVDRRRIEQKLKRCGIETRPFFHPISSLPMFSKNPERPVARQLFTRGLTLPSGAKLSRKDVQWICHALRKELV